MEPFGRNQAEAIILEHPFPDNIYGFFCVSVWSYYEGLAQKGGVDELKVL